jgi:hypothetical protein
MCCSEKENDTARHVCVRAGACVCVCGRVRAAAREGRGICATLCDKFGTPTTGGRGLLY